MKNVEKFAAARVRNRDARVRLVEMAAAASTLGFDKMYAKFKEVLRDWQESDTDMHGAFKAEVRERHSE